MTNRERKKQWVDYTKALAIYLAGTIKFAYSLPDDDNPAPTEGDTSIDSGENPPPPLPPQPPK